LWIRGVRLRVSVVKLGSAGGGFADCYSALW
jgi:hypothetical protein